MRGLAWVGCVLVLAACTRENAAFDEGGAGASSTVEDDGPTSKGDGPGSNSGSNSGSADGTTNAEDATGSVTGEDGPQSSGNMEASGTTEGPLQDCCQISNKPGCDSEPMLEQEVCDIRMECCTMSWDQQCVELVALLGFHGCGVNTEQCCGLVDSCELRPLAECVCQHDETCCAAWHPGCINVASMEVCFAVCDAPNNCCFAHEGMGCNDEATEDCVCMEDMPCCESGPWDADCAAAALLCETVCVF